MRPRKGGTLFGHSSDCYNWDNRCHCGSDQPLVLPPEDTSHLYSEGIQTGNGYVPGAAAAYSGDPVATASMRGQYGVASRVSQGRGRDQPLLGHAPQCYHLDNRCHCSSSEPYLLPPEGSPYSSSSSSHLVPHHYLYDTASQSAMSTTINTNTSSLHHSSGGAAARTHSQGSAGFGAQGNQQNPVWDHTQQVRNRTNPALLGHYNNRLRTQLGDQLISPEHNPPDDLPPSYSELFPDK